MRDSILQVALPLLVSVLLSVARVAAQQETLVYLPFGWDGLRNAPISASNLGVDAAATQTTWGLYERPLDREVGPATVIQGPAPGQASLVYAAPIIDGLPPQTITGDCVISTPVAVCSMTVDIPTGRVTVRPTATARVNITAGADGDVRETGRAASGNGGVTILEPMEVKGWIMVLWCGVTAWLLG